MKKKMIPGILILMFAVCSVAAQESTSFDPLRDLERSNVGTWNRYWNVYARRMAEMDGRYYFCATYDKRYPSSTHETVLSAMQKLKQTVRIESGNLIRKKIVRPDIEEAEAGANLLPGMTLDQYGYILSAEIDKKYEARLMSVEDVILVDEKAVEAKKRRAQDSYRGERYARELADLNFTIRDRAIALQDEDAFEGPILVRGFDTVGLVEGGEWRATDDKSPGIQVAVVGQATVMRRSRGATMLLAIPAERFSRGCSEPQFVAMLAAAGMTPDAFCELVVAKKRDLGDDAEAAVFAALREALPEEVYQTDPSATAKSEGGTVGGTDGEDKDGGSGGTSGKRGLTFKERLELRKKQREAAEGGGGE